MQHQHTFTRFPKALAGLMMVILLLSSLVWGIPPQTARAASRPNPANKVTINLEQPPAADHPDGYYTVNHATRMITLVQNPDNGMIELTGTVSGASAYLLEVKNGAEVYLLLNNVNLTNPARTDSPLKIRTGANVTLDLEDQSSNFFQADTPSYPGIWMYGDTLSIVGGGVQKNGTLTAIGSGGAVSQSEAAGGAGIGGRSYQTTPVTVSIYPGANVTAIGGSEAAGIGGGGVNQNNAPGHVFFSGNLNLTQYGGRVEAIGGTHGAGIGGGSQNQIADITVTMQGGTLIARGGRDAAGIGSGYKPQASTVMTLALESGEIIAEGAGVGSGIGYGAYDGNLEQVNLTIGATARVFAVGGLSAQSGIGYADQAVGTLALSIAQTADVVAIAPQGMAISETVQGAIEAALVEVSLTDSEPEPRTLEMYDQATTPKLWQRIHLPADYRSVSATAGGATPTTVLLELLSQDATPQFLGWLTPKNALGQSISSQIGTRTLTTVEKTPRVIISKWSVLESVQSITQQSAEISGTLQAHPGTAPQVFLSYGKIGGGLTVLTLPVASDGTFDTTLVGLTPNSTYEIWLEVRIIRNRHVLLGGEPLLFTTLGDEIVSEDPKESGGDGETPPSSSSEGENPPSNSSEGENPPSSSSEGENPPSSSSEGENPPDNGSGGGNLPIQPPTRSWPSVNVPNASLPTVTIPDASLPVGSLQKTSKPTKSDAPSSCPDTSDSASDDSTDRDLPPGDASGSNPQDSKPGGSSTGDRVGSSHSLPPNDSSVRITSVRSNTTGLPPHTGDAPFVAWISLLLIGLGSATGIVLWGLYHRRNQKTEQQDEDAE